MYRVYLFPIDEDRILFFACPQERTEREVADRKKAEAATRQKQVDEERQQKVTMQSSAVTLSRFCAYVSCSFLSNLRRSDFDFCMSPGAHRTRKGRQKGGGGSRASKASGWGATAKANHANFCSTALSILCICMVFISFQFTEIGFEFLHVPRSASNERRRTERRRRWQSVKSKLMRSNSKS